MGVIFALVAVALVLNITFTVLTLYTLNQHTRVVARDIQRAAITYLLIISALPFVIILLSYLLPRSSNSQTFCKGSIRSKSIILAIGTSLCVIIAGFKAGTAWEAPRPINNPAWYDSKACFYIFNFTCEILIVYLYITTRIDRGFHVPDGSGKRKTYDLQRKEEELTEQ